MGWKTAAKRARGSNKKCQVCCRKTKRKKAGMEQRRRGGGGLSCLSKTQWNLRASSTQFGQSDKQSELEGKLENAKGGGGKTLRWHRSATDKTYNRLQVPRPVPRAGAKQWRSGRGRGRANKKGKLKLNSFNFCRILLAFYLAWPQGQRQRQLPTTTTTTQQREETTNNCYQNVIHSNT